MSPQQLRYKEKLYGMVLEKAARLRQQGAVRLNYDPRFEQQVQAIEALVLQR